MAQKRLFLIDTFGFIFRAYHARARSGAPPMRTSTGLSTEAVFIFNTMLRKLIQTYKPNWIAAVFESIGPTLREQEFAAYKANRTEMPPDLTDQLPYIRRIIEAMRIPILEYRGFEADDVIGTIACRAQEAGVEVVIVSSDKDMLQLVSGGVSMLNPMKDDLWYDEAKVLEFMGVKPSQVADLLALKGDSIDNIPGAPGIGDKGAKDLIEKFGSVEAALDRAVEVDRKMYRESLQKNRDQILLSKRLATIETAVPIEFTMDAVVAHDPDVVTLKKLYQDLEFHSLVRELGPSGDTSVRDYQSLGTPESIESYLNSIPRHALLAVAMEAEHGELDFRAIGLSAKAGVARAIPLQFSELLRPLLEDPEWPKIASDVKSATLALEKVSIHAQGFAHDVMLYAFLLDADPGGCSLTSLAQRRFDLKLGPSPEQQADCAFELYEKLSSEVDARGLRELYETMDLPLTGVLARMESAGIRIDPVELQRLSVLLDTSIRL